MPNEAPDKVPRLVFLLPVLCIIVMHAAIGIGLMPGD